MYEYCCYGIDWELDEETSFTGDLFQEMVDLLFDCSDTFSLNVSRWDTSTDQRLEKELEPYLVKKYDTYKWFGYDYTQAPCEEDRFLMRVYMYEANENTKNILLRYIDDLFLNHVESEKLVDSTLTLEDLAFFQGEKMVLGTVSHEMIAKLCCKDKVFENLLERIGNWKYEAHDEIFTIASFLTNNHK